MLAPLGCYPQYQPHIHLFVSGYLLGISPTIFPMNTVITSTVRGLCSCKHAITHFTPVGIQLDPGERNVWDLHPWYLTVKEGPFLQLDQIRQLMDIQIYENISSAICIQDMVTRIRLLFEPPQVMCGCVHYLVFDGYHFLFHVAHLESFSSQGILQLNSFNKGKTGSVSKQRFRGDLKNTMRTSSSLPKSSRRPLDARFQSDTGRLVVSGTGKQT